MSTVEVGQDTDVSTPLAGESVTVVADYQVEVIQELEQGPPGPQGPSGAPSTIPGPQGPKGDPGNTVLYGPVDPVNSDGVNGDFYINTATHFIFGPKAANVWPAGTSLIGPQGIPGNTILYGAADPTGAVGVNGNFYINTTTHFMFGPKAGGAWPAGTSLVGPQGPQGIQGIQGIQGNTGTRGSLWYEGAGAPGTIAGALANDNYLDTTNGDVYNYSGSAWGSPVGNIRGPQGIQGPPGAVPEAPTDGAYYTRRNGAWFDGAGAFVRFDGAQPALTVAQKAQARSNVYAAPLDALASNGMQFNGGFEVAQDVVSTTAHSTFFCDGWCLYALGTVGAWARWMTGPNFPAPGSNNYGSIEITAAQAALGVNDGVGMYQVIEAYRMARLGFGNPACQPMTLSFWSAHVRTGMYSGTVKNTLTGYCYVFEYTQAASGVAQHNVIQIPPQTAGGAPSNLMTGAGFYLTFAMAAGSGLRAALGWNAGTTGVIASNNQINGVAATTDRFYIGNVALLPGNEAPTSDRSHLLLRPYADELRTAMRYWETGGFAIGGISGAALNRNFQFTLPYKERKRTAPTALPLSNLALTRSTMSIYGSQIDNIILYASNTTANDDWFASGNWAVNARLN
ncbi:hypothetical protein ABH994_007494 [Bradyrhizobium yuanmingense]|uniref:hypothetical protein n=1 Tax=Bradyrhizobium yuanmingense TaxID=108015 RepID=UPI003514C34D